MTELIAAFDGHNFASRIMAKRSFGGRVRLIINTKFNGETFCDLSRSSFNALRRMVMAFHKKELDAPLNFAGIHVERYKYKPVEIYTLINLDKSPDTVFLTRDWIGLKQFLDSVKKEFA